MDIESNSIYEQVANQISKVINELSIQQDIGEMTAAIESLNILNDSIQKEYDELKRLSEWKRFTIAFYGETNAGKSTLIEALRLLLNEPTKLESQKQFKALAAKSGLTQNSFEKVRQSIMDSEQAIKAVQQSLDQINRKFAEPIMLAKVEVERLNKLLEGVKANQNWWRRIIAWFFAPKEKVELTTAKQALVEIQEEQKNELVEFENRLKDLEQEKQNTEADHGRLLIEAEKLKRFADGQIIGDGRSDFTRNNTSFDFSYNNQEFSLIDVPGIEGDENIVRIPIEEAVKKAHAVFYVTRTPRPPQTHEGEGSKKGTLEKMKDHLGAQTEVWAIYNHAVNNPRQLKKPLIGQGEQEGLQALDDKLRQELADKYCQSLVVSARPAYLGLTECVVPGSKEAGEQRKFLERFESKEEILKLSGLLDFVEKLSSTIIGDYRNKIKRSNLNKAAKVLEVSLNELFNLNEKLNKDRKEVRSEVLNVQIQIKVLLEQFSGSLDSVGSKIVRSFEKEIRDQLYREIDSDIDNAEFKDVLHNVMESKSENLEKDLRCSIEEEVKNFEIEISRIVQRSTTHLNNIVNSQDRSFKREKFNIDIKIDNGVKLLELISSGIGIVTGMVLLISGGGWVVGVLALVGAVFGFAKSVIGFCSTSYKQSQQKKETDKVIRNANSKIHDEIAKILGGIKQAMTDQIQAVFSELEVPLKQYESIIKILKQAETELTAISCTIKN